MNVDLKRTKRYYADVDNGCSCDPCQNYCRAVRRACPELTAFLAEQGAAADQPLEVLWYSEKKNSVTCSALYVLCGTVEPGWTQPVDGAELTEARHFPDARAEAPFFVLNAGPFTLDWILEKPFEEAFPAP